MTKRDADPVTVDHIIELRKEIRQLEKLVEFYTKAADNSANAAVKLYHETIELKNLLRKYNDNYGSDLTDQRRNSRNEIPSGGGEFS